MKKYVAGFLFSKDSSHVVLIQKLNPQWQRGLFNGVGGKIEENESSCDAMVREFAEETGVTIAKENWTCYTQIHRPGYYDLDVYFAHSDFAFEARTIEKEQVHIFKVNELPANLIPNLKWLIPLALDQQADFSNPFSLREIATERTEA
ncbi:NUDIX domain-containing protein [Thalassomonas sp. RHCl1]|uniref:NUDIX domain-containing protein n=1 Tax=Thalassomonas sp. RHCl1 TaxID=2995320 RepID=UPI00248AAE9B|nr:NUDIX domain-containing protein [Thalassomonas sp. RHCl1]